MAVLVLKGAVEKDVVEIHYVFDVINSDELSLECDITDHVAENGSTLQEHTTLPPIEFTIEGFCGEQVFRNDLEVTNKVSSSLSKLQPVAAFLPSVSSYAQTAVAASAYIESSINKYKQSFQKLKGVLVGNEGSFLKRQTRVARDLQAMRDNRTLVSIVCDLGTFDNMLIKSVRIRQEDTTSQSRLVVELKQYNVANTQLVAIDTKKYAGRCAAQLAAMENLGKIQGKSKSLFRSAVSPSVVPFFTGVN